MNYKKVILIVFCILIMSTESFSAIVSDNDGAAFVTKAEFDALKSNFNRQIDEYNNSIDGKIDGAIASYLAGLALTSAFEQKNLFTNVGGVKFGSNYDYTTKETHTFNLQGESLWGIVNSGFIYRFRRMMIEDTKKNMTYESGAGSNVYGGDKGVYLYVTKGTYGYQWDQLWENVYVDHFLAGANMNSGSGVQPTKNVWATVTPFKDFTEYTSEDLLWGPNTGDTDRSSTVHVASIFKNDKETPVTLCFSNTLSTSNKYCIIDIDKNKVVDYHQGKVNSANSTWGWVGWFQNITGTTLKVPNTDIITYYLKKPKSTQLVPANNFVHNKLSDAIGKKVLLTDGAPFVKVDAKGVLSFKLKMTCDTSGKTVKFGLHKNTPFSNNNTIDTNIPDINLTSTDYSYNCDTSKILNIKFEVNKDDIIYLKVDTSGLAHSTSKSYYVTPTIMDLMFTVER